MNKNSNRLDFCVESLEQRKLLAGNVSVAVNSAGDLTVTGDNEENRLTVIVFPEQNEIQISPDDNSTAINGHLPGTDVTLNIGRENFRDLKINMRGGDDVFAIGSNGAQYRKAIARAGSGNDTIVISDSKFSGNVSISLGSGNPTNQPFIDQIARLSTSVVDGNFKTTGSRTKDLITVSFSTINGRTNIRTGSGSDSVSHSATVYGGAASSNTGSGGDRVTVSGVTALDQWTVSGGSGEDTLATRRDAPSIYVITPRFVGIEFETEF